MKHLLNLIAERAYTWAVSVMDPHARTDCDRCYRRRVRELSR